VFKQILVPLDRSTGSASFVPEVKAIALASEAELTLLHVVAPDAQPGETRAPTAELGALAHELRGAGITVRVRVRSGDVADVIDELIAALDVDLVAMATHGRTGVERMVAGSVADRVLADTTTPLLLLLRTNQPGRDRLETTLCCCWLRMRTHRLGC
jgi:nucleotide-binding universal stress UspA family protein